ncbi:HAD hydrolase-like protein [Kamptonema cortianum]|nr:HAD hydrolase-like protein [Geitlerinema splendidum]MDK3155232.1 HAD hydrolase-like protein [Kamptonema cortianum]
MFPRLVVFDMTGTTVYDDGAVNRSIAEALTESKLATRTPQVAKYRGLMTSTIIRNLLRDAGDPRHELASEIEPITKKFCEKMISHIESERTVGQVPGAIETIDWLKQKGCLIALDTGLPRPVADAYIDRLGWRGGLINYIVTADDVDRGRPHPATVSSAMKFFGLENPVHVAKVGDTPQDLIQGKSAGCGWVVGVTQGAFSSDALHIYPHTHLIPTISQLYEVFDPSEDNEE